MSALPRPGGLRALGHGCSFTSPLVNKGPTCAKHLCQEHLCGIHQWDFCELFTSFTRGSATSLCPCPRHLPMLTRRAGLCLPLLTLLPGFNPSPGTCSARMGCVCFFLKPSRLGFTFPPSASPQEPGFPPEPMVEVGCQASWASQCKAAGHNLSLLRLIQSGQITRLGPPAYPFSVPLSPDSQHKHCQSPPSSAQHTPALHGALSQP